MGPAQQGPGGSGPTSEQFDVLQAHAAAPRRRRSGNSLTRRSGSLTARGIRVNYLTGAKRRCLVGDLIGVRLPRDHLGQPPPPGRSQLNTRNGQHMTVSVPAG